MSFPSLRISASTRIEALTAAHALLASKVPSIDAAAALLALPVAAVETRRTILPREVLLDVAIRAIDTHTAIL